MYRCTDDDCNWKGDTPEWEPHESLHGRMYVPLCPQCGEDADEASAELERRMGEQINGLFEGTDL